MEVALVKPSAYDGACPVLWLGDEQVRPGASRPLARSSPRSQKQRVRQRAGLSPPSRAALRFATSVTDRVAGQPGVASDGPHPCLAAVVGVADVLAGGPIHLTCKRTWLSLARRSSHPRRRPLRFRSGRAAELWLGPVALLLLVGGEVVLYRNCVLPDRGLHLCGAHNERPTTGHQKSLPVAPPPDDEERSRLTRPGFCSAPRTGQPARVVDDAPYLVPRLPDEGFRIHGRMHRLATSGQTAPRRPLRKPRPARTWCPRSWRSSSAGVSSPRRLRLAPRAAGVALGRQRIRPVEGREIAESSRRREARWPRETDIAGVSQRL